MLSRHDKISPPPHHPTRLIADHSGLVLNLRHHALDRAGLDAHGRVPTFAVVAPR